MFAVKVELLSGRYVATAFNDRERVEWPPHPARLFSALVATWADGTQDETQGETELEALRWLEKQDPPEILASSLQASGARTVAPVFVPVNDVSVVEPPSRDKLDEAVATVLHAADAKVRQRAEKALAKLAKKHAADTTKAIGVPKKFTKAGLDAAEKLVTDRRTRQPRTFPSAAPEHHTIGFVWRHAAPPPEVSKALGHLLARVVRIGHSSSLVCAAPIHAEEIARLTVNTTLFVPDDDGTGVIRWVAPGQVDRLLAAFDLHRESEPRVLAARFVRYRQGARQSPAEDAHSAFDQEIVVFARVGGPRLPITSSVGLARQMRRALMAHSDQPVHEVLSGHRPGGGASEAIHLAVVPLPVVLGAHADGAIVGVALVLPRELGDSGRLAVMRAIGRFEQSGQLRSNDAEAPVVRLMLGDAGVLELRRVAWGEDRRATLRSTTWCRRSRRWATATPIALDHNPGDLHNPDPEKRSAAFRQATASLVDAVKRIGLPAPAEVDVVRSCVLPGTAKPRNYPRFPIDHERPQRVLVHARLVFRTFVRGPVLVGAGRYQGLGLCLPVDEQRFEVEQ